MTVELFANAASTTLNGAIDAVQTTLVVTSAALFPVAGNFRIKIESELLIVTGVAGTTFTVTRGAEGSTAAAHADTKAVDCIVTAGAFAQLKKDAQGWITALDYDFTAQGAQTLATDTTYTIGGVTWTKVNSTHDQTAMAMGATNGLLIQPKGDGSNYNDGNWTASGLQVPLTQIIPDIAFGMQIRVSAYCPLNNSAGNYDGAVVAVDYLGHSNYWMVRGYSGGQYFYASVGNNGTAIPGAAVDTANTSDNVYVLTVPSFGDPTEKTRSGSWSAGWPAASALHAHAQISGSIVTPNMGLPSNWAVSLYGVRVSSGTALTIGFKNLRVEYRY